MPRQLTVTEVRLNNIVASLTSVVPLLDELHDGFGTPFLQGISNTTLSLVAVVQNVKRNKEECAELMENIHGLLYAIISLHIKSEPKGFLPPLTLDHLAKFTETLQKIYMFVEWQQGGNKIKHFLRQNEITTMLKECREGLRRALDAFKIDTTILTSIAGIRETAKTMHEQLLELISSLSDATASDRTSSIYMYSNGSHNSSNSLSMLPSMPKIFHGREAELQDIIQALNGGSPRITILGGGGMGKTSLALAALHYPDIVKSYEHRFFVACDSSNSCVGIAAALGAHIGLKPGKDLRRPLLQFLSAQPLSLLVLDNLETTWEPMESRGDVEEFLSLLADIPHLALIITMRGAERPGKVRWTHPFLQPLKPLPNDAAWQTFIDIAEDSHKNEDINKVLSLTDNMPLAVDLIAHLASYEGCSNVLSRWETERTSLLSDGHDKRSSLDASIALSLSSNRMNSLPGSKELLSLLSILPDGLSDVELLQSKLPIQNVLGCKNTLLATSLAYTDGNKRLKSLVPIREHILKFHPPSKHLFEALRKHFHLLLDLYTRYRGVQQMQISAKMDQIRSNFGNLQQILQHALHPENPHLLHAIRSTISLNSFSRVTGHGWLKLMDQIPGIIPQLCNHGLEVEFITETLCSGLSHAIQTPELLVAQGITIFSTFNHPVLESKFYSAAGYYYYYSKDDPSSAMQFLEKALELGRFTRHIPLQCQILERMANIKWLIGDYPASRTYAREGQRLAQIVGDCYEEAKTLHPEALCCTSLGDYKQSMILLNRGRYLLKLCGLSGGALDFNMMNVEAEVHLLKSEYAQSRQLSIEIINQSNAAGERDYSSAFPLLSVAEVDVMIGAAKADVHENLDKAMLIFKTNKISHGILSGETVLADLLLRDKDTITAKIMFQECFNSSWGMGKRGEAVSYCMDRLADTGRWRVTDFDWSSRWTVVYLGYAKLTQTKMDLSRALQLLADVFLFNGDDETAHSLFIVALEGFTYMDVHRSRAICMLRLGDLAERRGQLMNAVELWKGARPLFEQSSQIQDVGHIDARLRAVGRKH